MTCEQVRELLAEHLLGSLDDDQDREVRRHLRACAACRKDREALEVGVDAFSRAAHDREPPEGLRDRVLSTLAEEWRDSPVVVPETPNIQSARPSRWRRTSTWALAAAIVALLAIAATGWGGTQAHRADLAEADAHDYRNVLQTLGGKDFRVGTLTPQSDASLSGQVLVYDGQPDGSDRSWAMVMLRAPGASGTATAHLIGDGGKVVELPEMHFGDDGDASTWLVSSGDLTDYHRLVVTDAGGAQLASGTLSAAD